MAETSKSIYQFSAKLNNGKEQDLSDYKGKVLLVVNIASACGFTPQLKELQQLQESFANEEFAVLGFPSNDFGAQEPLEGQAISNFCELNYGVQFPVFSKIKVKGQQADPLFKFLSSKTLNGTLQSTPRWNFHKYLIDKNGRVTDFFYPFTKPMAASVKKKIQKLL